MIPMTSPADNMLNPGKLGNKICNSGVTNSNAK